MKCRSLSLSLSFAGNSRLTSFRYFSKAVAAAIRFAYIQTDTSTEKTELNFYYTSDRLGKIRPPFVRGREALLVVAVSRPTYCLLFHNFAFNQVCATAAAAEAVRAAQASLPKPPPPRGRNAYPPPSSTSFSHSLPPSLPPSLPLRRPRVRVRLFLPYQL